MHTQSGALTFAACQQLFRYHPLAITPPPAGTGGRWSMVLRHRTAGFFVLTQPRENLFVLRPWHDRDGLEEEIQPGKPVPDVVRTTVAGCLPVPRHGALLGWVTGRQVTALLTVHSAPPEGGQAGPSPVPGPEVRVLPLDGTTKEWHWPPFTVSPLDDWRLWEYVEWHELIDAMPLLSAEPGRAFWLPAPDGRRTGHVIVRDNIRTDAFWLPAGVYSDHWALREGIQPPPGEQLIASPDAVDLARGGLW